MKYPRIHQEISAIPLLLVSQCPTMARLVLFSQWMVEQVIKIACSTSTLIPQLGQSPLYPTVQAVPWLSIVYTTANIHVDLPIAGPCPLSLQIAKPLAAFFPPFKEPISFIW